MGRKLENSFDNKKRKETKKGKKQKIVCIHYSDKQIKGFKSMDLLSKKAGKKKQAHKISLTSPVEVFLLHY